MHLKIASRSSDLARWQAYAVERAIKAFDPKITTEMIFKSSFGDRNLDLPLSQMESRGVFTEDFYQDLLKGAFDLVVHSWKDLPVEDRKGTQIVATLAREDVRDILLIPEEVWASSQNHLRILTSSPRRVYNLSQQLMPLLPNFSGTLEFAPVRGNIPSRVDKMFDQHAGLVMAKAALDRMLTPSSGFEEVAQRIRQKISQCRFMVLPLSLNPTAPAQGALAIEIAEGREDLKEIFKSINHPMVYRDVLEERETLKSYGGGCHQKIGMNVLSKPSGVYRVLKGLTDSQVVLDQVSFQTANTPQFPTPQSEQEIFPSRTEKNSWFVRKSLPPLNEDFAHKAVVVSRVQAYQNHLSQAAQIWVPGLETWRALASMGRWVNGCFEGFGEGELHWAGPLTEGLSWVKLSHSGAKDYESELPIHPTYELIPRTKEQSPELTGKKYFFWMSASSFERAKSLFPREIAEGFHGCGPGITARFLEKSGIEPSRIQIFLNLDDFLKHLRRPS